MSKIIQIFLNFCLHRRMGIHFLLLAFFDNLYFWRPLHSKNEPNFSWLRSSSIVCDLQTTTTLDTLFSGICTTYYATLFCKREKNKSKIDSSQKLFWPTVIILWKHSVNMHLQKLFFHYLPQSREQWTGLLFNFERFFPKVTVHKH